MSTHTAQFQIGALKMELQQEDKRCVVSGIAPMDAFANTDNSSTMLF